MKQNLQQIKEITLGAARVTEEADGFHFYRFTEEQEAFYQFRKADYYKKTFSSSGIKLSFRTDSRTLFLKGTLAQGSSRWYYAFDVFVNGTKVDTIDNFSGVTLPADYAGVTLPVGDFEKTFFLGDGEKDVCVYLPWTMKTVLQEVSLDDGAWIQPVRPSKKMLCFGDSITQGYDALYPSNKYITRFAELMGAEEYNKAIGGERFVPGLAALREEFDPDYITVAYGTNDWCHLPREESIYNAQMFFQYLHNYYPNANIFVITPIWRKAHEEFRVYGKFEEVEQNLRNITERYENVMVISGYSFVEPDEKLFADLCLHPNDAGFDQYFEGLKNGYSKENALFIKEEIKMKRIEHNEEKWIFPFLEYVPENGGENLPLVMQLHGAGERGYGKKDLDLLDVHGFSHILKEGEFPCRVVMPQCPKDTFWAARVESIHAFIDQITEEFSVDPDRISLTGMSMGGFGTWFTAMAKPKRFSAIAPICGGCMPWNSGVLKKLPIWVFHGAEDPTVDVHYSRDMVEKLESIGGNVKFTCYEGVRHNSWVYACNSELLEWLISHKRT